MIEYFHVAANYDGQYFLNVSLHFDELILTELVAFFFKRNYITTHQQYFICSNDLPGTFS